MYQRWEPGGRPEPQLRERKKMYLEANLLLGWRVGEARERIAGGWACNAFHIDITIFKDKYIYSYMERVTASRHFTPFAGS